MDAEAVGPSGYVSQNLMSGERIRYVGRIHWSIYLPGIIFAPFVIGFAFLLIAWLRRVSTELVVTDRRVLVKTGLLSRNVDELRLDKVESVQATTFLGFSWGSLRIVGSGGTFRVVHNVDQPMAFRNAVQQLADEVRNQNGNPQLRHAG